MPPQTHEISEDSNDDTDIDIDIDIQTFTHRGCCFWIPCFDSSYKTTDPWWTRGWKSIREWSEVTAGPKWKTFIRTFKKNHHCLILGVGGGGAKQPKFQYDPLSYALNFDDGPGHYIDEDYIARDFSTRFASVPAGCHSMSSSVDFGKEAPINLTT